MPRNSASGPHRLLPDSRKTLADIDRPPQQHGRSALQALTAAALLLPGLTCPSAQADTEDEVAFQFGHYREGSRRIVGVPNTLQPISVDSLYGKSGISLPAGNGLTLSYSQDTWSGATPITTAPVSANGNRPVQTGSAGQLVTVGASPMINGQVMLDGSYRPVKIDPVSGKPVAVPREVVHTLASASPETRRQLDFKLDRNLDQGALTVGGGISQERDYESRFVNLGRRIDFNQNLTTLRLGLSYTRSETAATLDHDAAPYITKTAYLNQIENVNGNQVLHGKREDWGASAGVTQVINPSALLEANLAYTRSSGYLANPYKVMTVIFANPPPAESAASLIPGNVQALLEQRPDVRNQWSIGGRLIQHVSPLDGALRLGYRYSRDDWGIAAHSVETDWSQPLGGGWMLAPRLRYYTQSAASLYSPYLVSRQPYRQVSVGADGQVVIRAFDPGKLPAHFSSDHRLSGFGTLGVGIGLAKQLARGVSLEAGIDYTRQAGSLKIGGGGEGSYADFNYVLANVALRFDLANLGGRDAPPGRGDPSPEDAHNHHNAQGHLGFVVPAGVMYAHMLDTPGEVMVGYRYMAGRDAGTMQHGSATVGDDQLLMQGCPGKICFVRPVEMNMRMHMLDFMIGLTDRVSLMVMPQDVTMEMDSRLVTGAPTVPADTQAHVGIHETGGFGDTLMHALFKLSDDPSRRWVLAFGLSAPTGDAGIKLRRSHQQEPVYTHYGMQLGSGTWDFVPNLTYLGQSERWSWGGQMGATVRLQARNKEGYALGNAWKGTGWIAYRLNAWLAASLRGVYTAQGAIKGEYQDSQAQSAPPDFPSNYGGRFADIGLGVTAQVPSGGYRGTSLGIELLLPRRSEVNGYQLPRARSLMLNWNYHF